MQCNAICTVCICQSNLIVTLPQLKVGDTLRVMAEQDFYDENGTWKAIDAVLVSSKAENSPNLPSKKDIKRAEARVLMDAEGKLGQVLSQNLCGKGWVSLKSIWGWFSNESPEIKEALDIVKTRHLQVRFLSIAHSAPLMMRNIYRWIDADVFRDCACL